MFFDIHSHILPSVDDGAKNIEEALEILKLMKNDGITDVIATPHFYPQDDNLDVFQEKISLAFETLKEAKQGLDLPNIYLGTEMFYFDGIGSSDSLSYFCLNNSKYLLLELTDYSINESTFEDILLIIQNWGIIPIIAHIERYAGSKKYRKFLKFIKSKNIPAQINASSFLDKKYTRTLKYLISNNIATFLSTDSHSVTDRKPELNNALNIIRKKFGEEVAEKFIKNSKNLYNEICDIND